METIHKWMPHEFRIHGPEDGNPYKDHWISMDVEGPLGCKSVPGFYDGNGEYVVRFMPEIEGEHFLHIYADFLKEPFHEHVNILSNLTGCHGPVHVAGTHFVYADGSPYLSIGTTCYVWLWQNDDLIEQTIQSLKKSPFNKIRFCVFPKHYPYNLGEPRSYPYPGTPMDSSVLTDENFMQYGPDSEGNQWETDRFQPEHFRHLEWCIEQLMKIGIEADVILFHPYDRWGFSSMDKESDLFYIRYICARLSAFPNVWWSLANEYDLLQKKFPQKSIDATMWFIDDSLCKNRRYYTDTAIEDNKNKVAKHILYGGDLFKEIFKRIDVWDEICNHLSTNKKERTDEILEIPDFDTSKEILDALKKIKAENPNLIRKLLSDKPQYQQLRFELFNTNYNLSKI